jgi:SAM-dependent methyltransferase
MAMAPWLKPALMAARKRRALWVRVLDLGRTAATGEGRAMLWTRLVHRGDVHQTTPFTREDRYPELFDLAASLAPAATRILSFGCSTGAELVALRRRFPDSEIVGAEINPRSRGIAAARVRNDARTAVVSPGSVAGRFDAIFALAVLQREPHKMSAMGVEDLSAYYPFERFDGAVRWLDRLLVPGGLLCVANAHYRVEDSSVAPRLEPVPGSPAMAGPVFGPDGKRLSGPAGCTMFRKCARADGAA